ncbi:hypothetical protein H0H87_003500 [Tephrocybe sp. NHM501043]|nr:hypothetical protein H0H87_003500 [Tephrocybe sp. NHM501043]
MFRTGASPYSPFFTSGLLSEPARSSSDTASTLSCEQRSFLSLDLAEPRRAKSATIPPSFTTIHPSSTTIPDPSLTPPSPASLRLRHSRDSLRTIPSPKPAPSITLPDLPTPSRRSSIQVGSIDAPPAHRRSTASTLTATSSVRKVNRSHALARLEGRTRSTRRPRPPVKRNFMSMTDDDSDADREDNNGDDDDHIDDHRRRVALSVLNEPEDLVLPPPTIPLYDPRSAPVGGRFPSLSLTSRLSSPRKKRTTTKEWFPLKSFIDLQASPDREDDFFSRWSWRSFIEVASVS